MDSEAVSDDGHLIENSEDSDSLEDYDHDGQSGDPEAGHETGRDVGESDPEGENGLIQRDDAKDYSADEQTDSEEEDEEEILDTEGEAPFRRRRPSKRTPRPIGAMERLWVLDVGFGLAAPLKPDKGQPRLGVHIRLGAGRRLTLAGNFSLWLGFGVVFHSVTKEDSTILNPEDEVQSQVKCEDSKGVSLWTLHANLWGEWAWWRIRFRLGAFSGAGYGDYTQLKQFVDASGSDLIGCETEEMNRWMGVAGGWTRLGWAFSKKAEAGLLLGSTFLFGTRRFHFFDVDGDSRALDVFSHMFEAGAYFSHRF